MLSGIGNHKYVCAHGSRFSQPSNDLEILELQHPERRVVMGSYHFADLAVEKGDPMDWLATTKF